MVLETTKGPVPHPWGSCPHAMCSAPQIIAHERRVSYASGGVRRRRARRLRMGVGAWYCWRKCLALTRRPAPGGDRRGLDHQADALDSHGLRLSFRPHLRSTSATTTLCGWRSRAYPLGRSAQQKKASAPMQARPADADRTSKGMGVVLRAPRTRPAPLVINLLGD